MVVCLTGDVHHRSLQTADQAALDVSEPETALRYSRIVSNEGLKATLFVTGRTAYEDPAVVKSLGEQDQIEVGGHNYGAFTIPAVPYSGILFRAYETATGDICPKWVQKHGIEKTKRRLEALTRSSIVSWRDHGFRNDSNTYELLKRAGIEHVSDERSPTQTHPYRSEETRSLLEVPVNVPPDHDHIDHGNLDPPAGWSDPFSNEIYGPDEWLKRVLSSVEQIDRAGGVATILAHPACMALVDEFGLFEPLCSRLSEYKTIHVREAHQFM